MVTNPADSQGDVKPVNPPLNQWQLLCVNVLTLSLVFLAPCVSSQSAHMTAWPATQHPMPPVLQVLSQKQTAGALGALLGSPGAAQPGAAAVTLTALGVSYQYRRQGLASQLLGYLQEVAAQLG
jgi:ribosomal protein S18 acetylase RimI-like enzyme